MVTISNCITGAREITLSYILRKLVEINIEAIKTATILKSVKAYLGIKIDYCHLISGENYHLQLGK